MPMSIVTTSLQMPLGAPSGPNPPTNFILYRQGGASHNQTSYQAHSWNAAVPTVNPIAGYEIWRNGAFLAQTAGLSYEDTTAVGSNDPTYNLAATIYSYQIRAVDSQGLTSAFVSPAVYLYQNGQANQSQTDYSYSLSLLNWAANLNGRPCIRCDYPAVAGAGFQPVTFTPMAPVWDLECGAYSFLTVDINPGPVVVDSVLNTSILTRLPHPPTGGDVFGWHPDLNIFNYGPAPQANTWATYRVPFAPLGLGVVQIQAAANAGVLTVTAILNGGPPLVDGGGSIYGPGVPPGTFLMGQNQNSAIGTFPINNSFFMPSSQITFQRSGIYKVRFARPNNGPAATFYLDNIGFV